MGFKESFSWGWYRFLLVVRPPLPVRWTVHGLADAPRGRWCELSRSVGGATQVCQGDADWLLGTGTLGMV